MSSSFGGICRIGGRRERPRRLRSLIHVCWRSRRIFRTLPMQSESHLLVLKAPPVKRPVNATSSLNRTCWYRVGDRRPGEACLQGSVGTASRIGRHDSNHEGGGCLLGPPPCDPLGWVPACPYQEPILLMLTFVPDDRFAHAHHRNPDATSGPVGRDCS